MSSEKPVVLLVDDSRVMRIALKKILQMDYEVVEATNGLNGWEALSENPDVECVFTDLSMPELDGFGLLKRIRTASDPRVKALPVIIITGNENDEAMRKDVLSKGANDIVLKPFQSSEILSTTLKYLGDPSAEPAPDPTPAPPASAPVKAQPARPSAASSGERSVTGAQMLARFKAQTEAALMRAKKAEEAYQKEQLERTAAQKARDKAEKAYQEVSQALAEAKKQGAGTASDGGKLQQQLDTTLQRMRAAEQARAAIEQELEQVRKEFMLRQKSSDRLRVDDETGRVKRELDAALKRAATAERMQREYEEELDQYKARIVELAQSNDSLVSDEVVNRQRAESRVKQLEAELEMASEQVAAYEGGRDERLDSEIVGRERLEAQLAQMEAGLREADKRAKTAEAGLLEADKRVKAAEAAAAHLQDELSTLQPQTDSIKEETRELLRVEEHARQQAETQVQRLRAELEEARTKFKTVEQKQLQAEQQKRKVEHEQNQLRAELEILRRDDGASAPSDPQLEQLKGEIEAALVRADAAELAQREAEDELSGMASGLEASEQAQRNAEHSVMRMTAQLNAMRKQLDKLPAQGEQEDAEPRRRKSAPSTARAEPAKAASEGRREPQIIFESEDEDGLDDLGFTGGEPQIDFKKDELVDLMPNKKRRGNVGIDRFNSTMVAMWRRQQRSRRALQLSIATLILALGGIGAYMMGWLPFLESLGSREVASVSVSQEKPQAERRLPPDPAPVPAQKAQVKTEKPQAAKPPPVVASKPAVSPSVDTPVSALPTPPVEAGGFEAARQRQEKRVREAAEAEFYRLLSAQREQEEIEAMAPAAAVPTPAEPPPSGGSAP